MRARDQRQGGVPYHIGQSQWPVKMGKQRAAARWLPYQSGAERLRREGRKDQPLDPCEMARGGFGDLIGGREMDETIGDIDRRAHGLARLRKRLPFGCAKNFVYVHAIPLA